MSSSIRAKNSVVPATPSTGYTELFFDTSDGHLKKRDDTGTVTDLEGGGAAISDLTGDVTATGPGSAVATLATVNSNVGTFGSASSVAQVTLNAKGLTTAGSSVSIQIAESQVTNLVSDLAGKQPTGNYITALTGDAAAAGPGSAAITFATVNSNVGTFGSASSVAVVTENAKGLTTAVVDTPIQIAESQVTNLVSDLAGKQPTGNYITALTGDGTAAGPGSAAFALATVNSNVGTFGSASSVAVVTENAKGLTTAAVDTPIQIAESQVTNLVSDLAGKQPTGNYVTALTGDVAATGPGSVAATLASIPNKVYVDFFSGNDAHTGTIVQPWKTIQHAYDSISPSINEPYVIYVSGGNNDTDSAITAKPNVSIVADYPIQVGPSGFTISGGSTNDNCAFVNIIFLGAFSWVRNDATAIGLTFVNSEFFSGPTFRQQGSGNAGVQAFNSVFVNSEFQLPNSYGVFNTCTFYGTTSFDEPGAAGVVYLEFDGGYSSGAMTFTGLYNPIYFTAFVHDVAFGASVVFVAGISGPSPVVMDANGLPPTYTGSPAITYLEQANYINGTLAIAHGGTGQTTKPTAFDALSPMTTQYDLIVGGASGTGTRLAKGADGTHLTTIAGVVAWTPDPTPYVVSSINSNTTAVSGNTYLCDTSGGAFNVTLPSPVSGAFIVIKDKTGSFGTNNLTVLQFASEKIEGLAASKILQTNWGAFSIFSDGTDWFMGPF